MRKFARSQLCLPAAVCGLLLAAPMSRASADAQTAETAGAPAQSFAAEISAQLAAFPDGGPELEAALSALVAAEPDGAAAVATLMVMLGNAPSAGIVTAISGAMTHALPYSLASLQAAIATAVANSADPVAAARGIIAASASLPASVQTAAGAGLAQAATQLTATGKGGAATLITFEAASGPTGMAGAFSGGQNPGTDRPPSSKPPKVVYSNTPESPILPQPSVSPS
jgi:hypothetical protein